MLRFGEALRNLSAGQFAEVLAKAARARHVVVGHDFRFGRHGGATAPVLAAAGERLGFAVEVLSPVMLDGERISSSGVRAALARGEFARAQRWLGRAYSMRGRVIAGKRLGRELVSRLPTWRSRGDERRLAGSSRYACAASRPGALPGVASLGTRPTVGGVEALLEAHLFDFSGDLYGREIEVEFVAKLRDERCFETLEALVAQMRRDADEARQILAAERRRLATERI